MAYLHTLDTQCMCKPAPGRARPTAPGPTNHAAHMAQLIGPRRPVPYHADIRGASRIVPQGSQRAPNPLTYYCPPWAIVALPVLLSHTHMGSRTTLRRAAAALGRSRPE